MYLTNHNTHTTLKRIFMLSTWKIEIEASNTIANMSNTYQWGIKQGLLIEFFLSAIYTVRNVLLELIRNSHERNNIDKVYTIWLNMNTEDYT